VGRADFTRTRRRGMTNNEIFEKWWEEDGKSLVKAQPDYRGTASTAFLEGLAIGRKERTVEITEKLAPWVPYLEAVMLVHYPECFDTIRKEIEK
jgi:hypothetical protein